MQTLPEIRRGSKQELSLLTPFEIGSGYAALPSADFCGDTHHALQICIVLHGAVEVVCDNYTRFYRDGELWWNMCWEPLSYRFAGRRTFILIINLDLEMLGACSPFSSCNWLTPFVEEVGKRYCPATREDREEILALGKELYHHSRKQPLNWKIESWLKIHQLILSAIQKMSDRELSGRVRTDNSESQNAFARIRYALNQVWAMETRPPSLSEAARICQLSPSRFSELFRQTMGVSYGKFVIRVRMSHAAKDLLSGRYTLEETAQKWGFFDTAHFCHSFKKFYQVSPSKFMLRSPGA